MKCKEHLMSPEWNVGQFAKTLGQQEQSSSIHLSSVLSKVLLSLSVQA